MEKLNNIEKVILSFHQKNAKNIWKIASVCIDTEDGKEESEIENFENFRETFNYIQEGGEYEGIYYSTEWVIFDRKRYGTLRNGIPVGSYSTFFIPMKTVQNLS